MSREWLGKRVRTDIAYFRNRFTDRIEFDFLAESGDVGEHRQELGARRGTLRVGESVAVRERTRELHEAVHAQFWKSDRSGIGAAAPNSGAVSVELAPRRWSLMAGARFVGERPEDDFVFSAINRNNGYENVFVNGSFRVTRHVELHVRVDNALDEGYQEVLDILGLGSKCRGGVKPGDANEVSSSESLWRWRLFQTSPQRIVSTAPSITELLYALGLGDRVVGVDRFSRYPAEALRKPKIGDYANPNLETIASLRPDLVIIPINPVKLAERLAVLRLKVLEIDQESIAKLYESFRIVGQATGATVQAARLTSTVQGQLETVRTRAAPLKRTRA